jgi:hypothetical protein
MYDEVLKMLPVNRVLFWKNLNNKFIRYLILNNFKNIFIYLYKFNEYDKSGLKIKIYKNYYFDRLLSIL